MSKVNPFALRLSIGGVLTDLLHKECLDSAGKVALLHALLKLKHNNRMQLQNRISKATKLNSSLRRNVKVAFERNTCKTIAHTLLFTSNLPYT
jgi:hypothetical protein